MAIIRTTEMTIHIQKLEQNYQELRTIIGGTEPNTNIWNLYSLNPDDYKRDFVEVNLTALDYAISAYKTSLEKLAKLESKQARPLATNR